MHAINTIFNVFQQNIVFLYCVCVKTFLSPCQISSDIPELQVVSCSVRLQELGYNFKRRMEEMLKASEITE